MPQRDGPNVVEVDNVESSHADPWLPRIAVVLLGLVGLGAATGATWITLAGHDIPPTISSIGTNATTTLGLIVIALTRWSNNGIPERSAPERQAQPPGR